MKILRGFLTSDIQNGENQRFEGEGKAVCIFAKKEHILHDKVFKVEDLACASETNVTL